MDLISVIQKKDQKFYFAVRNHAVHSNMSAQDKNNDEASSPAELLVGSLGLCIGMMIYRHCINHNYNNEQISLDITYLLTDNPKRIKNITIDTNLPKNFPDEKKNAILNISKTCVVHNTLMNKPEVDIDIV